MQYLQSALSICLKVLAVATEVLHHTRPTGQSKESGCVHFFKDSIQGFGHLKPE